MNKMIVPAVLVATGVAAVAAWSQTTPAFQNKRHSTMPLENDPTREVRLQSVTMPPGSGNQFYRHPGDQWTAVQEGEVIFTIKRQPPQVLKAGDYNYVPRGTIHRQQNLTDKPARYIEMRIFDNGKPASEQVPEWGEAQHAPSPRPGNSLMSHHAFAADELPKDLLLHCEGRMEAVMDLPSPQSRSATFRLNLHLKDGTITDTQTGVIEGEACVQNSGEIKCEVTKHYPLANSIIRRHSSVVVNRGTRVITLWVESWDYQGGEASGTPMAHMRVLRTGLCRDNALF